MRGFEMSPRILYEALFLTVFERICPSAEQATAICRVWRNSWKIVASNKANKELQHRADTLWESSNDNYFSKLQLSSC